jgi:hypothetical protein
MDALIVAGGGGDPLVGSIGEIEAEGLTGQIDVVSTDFLPDLDAQLESGGMFAESGGHYCDPLFAFLLTYNAIKGNESYLKPAGEFGKNLLFPYLYVASSEDYANYDKYFVQDTPYTDEELVAMAEMDYADLEAACSALSIEDVMARHGAGAAETEAETEALDYAEEVKADVDYLFVIDQRTLGKVLYLCGEMDGYYPASATEAGAAVRVRLESADGG